MKLIMMMMRLQLISISAVFKLVFLYIIEGVRVERESRKSRSRTSAMLQSSISFIQPTCGGGGRIESSEDFTAGEGSSYH